LWESDAQFHAVFDGALDALVIADDEGRCLEANAAAAALFGLERKHLLRRRIADFAAPASDVGRVWQEFLMWGQGRGDFRLVRPDGSACDLEYSVTADFLPGRHLAAFRDISERKRTEETHRFLAEVSHVLASSLDAQTTLDQIARLTVPHFADCCVVYLVDAGGQVTQLAVAHQDPARAELVRLLHQRYPLPP